MGGKNSLLAVGDSLEDWTTGSADRFTVPADEVDDVTLRYAQSDPSAVSAVGVYRADGTQVDQAYVTGTRPVYMPGTMSADTHHTVTITSLTETNVRYSLSTSSRTAQTSEQTPYRGTVSAIPGRIQAEDFDTGGQSVSYSDTSTGNTYDTTYRDADVDIRKTQDETGAYNIGYFADGEWLEYTVDPSPGRYALRVRVASANTGRQLRVLLGDAELATVEVPNTGGWRNWQTVTVNDIAIETDTEQVLRVEAVGTGIDLNWIAFAESTDFGELGYGAGAYGGQ